MVPRSASKGWCWAMGAMVLATVGTRLGLGLMGTVAARPEWPCRVSMATPRICVVERPRWTEQWDCELEPGRGWWWFSIQ